MPSFPANNSGLELIMDMILVSACLIGDPVRYDGTAKLTGNTHLANWRRQGRLVVFCPEIAGGLDVPRRPAELEPGATAQDVLDGGARIFDNAGSDVTRSFLDGALAALAAAQSERCRHAVLTDGSPSCGSRYIYTGQFDSSRKAGMGVTAALLFNNGIQVWDHTRIDDLATALSIK